MYVPDDDNNPLEELSKSLNLDKFARKEKNSNNLKRAFASRLKTLEASLEDKKLPGSVQQDIMTEISVLREILEE